MTLKQWLDYGWLKRHKTSPEEIESLFRIVDRDLKDSRSGVSPDWRFGIAYNAALKLCTILLCAEGNNAERNLHHYRTIQSLPKILGTQKNEDAVYLDACRTKRNMAEYDSVGVATEQEADELIDFVISLRDEVIGYLKMKYPELIRFRC